METPGTATHAFDAAIALAAADDDSYTGHTHPAYGNMVGPFGGAIGATLLHAVMRDPARLGEPLSLTVHYAAPVLGSARGLHFGKGFFDQSAEIWSADGVLLAASHQVVYFKE